MVVVAALLDPRWLVEIEAEAQSLSAIGSSGLANNAALAIC